MPLYTLQGDFEKPGFLVRMEARGISRSGVPMVRDEVFKISTTKILDKKNSFAKPPSHIYDEINC